jgi:DNA-binding transcriptional regulator LsrR (DeoR family)
VNEELQQQRYDEVLRLRHEEGASYRVIAKRMGISRERASSLYWKAVRVRGVTPIVVARKRS